MMRTLLLAALLAAFPAAAHAYCTTIAAKPYCGDFDGRPPLPPIALRDPNYIPTGAPTAPSEEAKRDAAQYKQDWLARDKARVDEEVEYRKYRREKLGY